MNRKALIPTLALVASFASAIPAFCAAPTKPLSAAEVVSRNVTARGGLQAWRNVKSISMSGTLGVGGVQRPTAETPIPGKEAEQLPSDVRPAQEVRLPFIMQMQRPRRVRLELQFKGQAAVQVYDGTDGWKIRPYLNRSDVEPYNASELKQASTQAELDGPLIDYAAKGSTVALDSTEQVEDRPCYKLAITLKSGDVIHVWVDAHTFLETKIEGQPRKLDGVEHPVQIYYRDYRSVNGLQIPYVLETAVLSGPKTKVRQTPIPAERILVEKVVVNPSIDASLFVRPKLAAVATSQTVVPHSIQHTDNP